MTPVFHLITLFPNVVRPYLETSILGRAHRAGKLDFKLIQLRDFSSNRHKSVDDAPYGGGSGMVLQVEPLALAVESIWKAQGRDNCLTLYFSSAGRRLNHTLLEAFQKRPVPHYILVCGHYEGVDRRFIDHWVDQEISLGDFVLTGGELPALAFVDSLARLQDGMFSTPEVTRQESFGIRDELGNPLLEYPHYTRPENFRGYQVPEILLSGNHDAIKSWRQLKTSPTPNRTLPNLPNRTLKETPQGTDA